MTGVERVELYGKRPECINISLLQDRMANLGVKPAEVLATLNGQNKTTYSGYYDNGDNRIRVTVSDKFKTVEDIGSMLIQGHDDDQLRMRDIARIEKGYEEAYPQRTVLRQRTGAGIYRSFQRFGHRESGRCRREKTGATERKPPARRRGVPQGILSARTCGSLFGYFRHQPDRVRHHRCGNPDAGHGFQERNHHRHQPDCHRIRFVPVPIGTADGTMQRVSLAAFVLAMGMLVDNAIVIVDGILVDLKAGKNRMEAMTAIGRQTAMPLLGATLIAIIAFLPIFLSPDTAGYTPATCSSYWRCPYC